MQCQGDICYSFLICQAAIGTGYGLKLMSCGQIVCGFV